MKTLSIDIETFSSENLTKCGVYRYAEAPDFEVLLFGYSADGAPVKVVDLAAGETIPADVRSALTDPAVTKWAFNAQFERVCLSRYLGYPTGQYLDPSSWHCTMVWAATLGLPLSLEGVGAVLGLEKQKLKEGKDLIRYFCTPAKVRDGSLIRHYPTDALEKWSLFKAYNLRDVETEMSIQQKLSKFPVTESEWHNYTLDQQINDRGIMLDRTLVTQAIRCDERFKRTHMEQARSVTGLDNPNSPVQLKAWLAEKGVEADSLSKAAVADMLEKADGEVELALSLRQELAKSSVKKYTAMQTVVGSDDRAILKYTRNVYYIGNLEFAKLTPGEAHFYDLNGDEIEKQTTEIKWDAEAAEKGGFEHFMMKEIHEQPKAVQDTLNSVIKDRTIDLSGVEITEEEIKNFEQIYIVACGSAWHVGMAAQYVLEDIADIPVRVELASEFRYRKMPLNQKALVIVVSQSGETADTLAALRMAKEKGITTMAIVNVVGSSIAREADKVFYTLAGPEISVATTKAYSAQLAAMYCLSVQFAKVREKITEEQYSYYISELLTLPEKMQKTLEDKERIQWFAAKYANAHDVFFVGRGIDYAVCLEGSLKLKEISYIHSEAYAAGELKHGTISLIEQGTLVIGVLTQSELYEKTISNMLECKSRGAYLMGLTTYGKYEIEDQVNFTVYVPKVDEHFVGSLAVIPLQLLGYYVSVAKGLDVDKPRNLAKSVTVE